MGNLIFRSSNTLKTSKNCNGDLDKVRKSKVCELDITNTNQRGRTAQAPIVAEAENITERDSEKSKDENTDISNCLEETDELTEVFDEIDEGAEVFDCDFHGEIKRKSPKNASKICCHQKESCDSYCVTCRTYICDVCICKHKGHDFKLKNELLESLNRRIRFLQNESEKHQLNLFSYNDQLRTLKLEQKRHSDSTSEAISKQHIQYVTNLESQTNSSLKEIFGHWKVYLKRYHPVKTRIEKLKYVHRQSPTIQKLLLQNNPIKVIIAADRLNQRFPMSYHDKSVALPKINYKFKIKTHHTQKVPNLWLLKSSNDPLNITNIIDCVIKLPTMNVIHSIETLEDDIFLSNSAKIIQSRSKTSRLVSCLEIEFTNRYMTVLGADEFLVCRRNMLLRIKKDAIPQKVREFEWFYPQGCCLCANGCILVCLASESKFNKDSLPVRTEIQKLDISSRTVMQISVRPNGLNYFTFPRRCMEHPLSCDIYVIDRKGPSSGQLLIFYQNGILGSIYNGRQIIEIIGKNNFFPTDVASSSTGFIVVTDKNNDALHILSQSGDAVYYILTGQLYGCRLRKPSNIAIDNKDNMHVVGSWSDGIIGVLKYPQLSQR